MGMGCWPGSERLDLWRAGWWRAQGGLAGVVAIRGSLKGSCSSHGTNELLCAAQSRPMRSWRGRGSGALEDEHTSEHTCKPLAFSLSKAAAEIGAWTLNSKGQADCQPVRSAANLPQASAVPGERTVHCQQQVVLVP